LKRRNCPACRLAAMNSSISGWSQRKVAIIAPRREPVERMVPHIESQICMKDNGPDAMPPVPRALVPRGRSVEKSTPIPPPFCMVTAASSRARKIPGIESSTGP